MEANFLLRLNGCQLAGGSFQKVTIGSHRVIRRGSAGQGVGRLRWSYTGDRRRAGGAAGGIAGVIEDRP